MTTPNLLSEVELDELRRTLLSTVSGTNWTNVQKLLSHIAALQAKLHEAKADGERLDWLDRQYIPHHGWWCVSRSPKYATVCVQQSGKEKGHTLIRDAIDAAREVPNESK